MKLLRRIQKNSVVVVVTALFLLAAPAAFAQIKFDSIANFFEIPATVRAGVIRFVVGQSVGTDAQIPSGLLVGASVLMDGRSDAAAITSAGRDLLKRAAGFLSSIVKTGQGNLEIRSVDRLSIGSKTAGGAMNISTDKTVIAPSGIVIGETSATAAVAGTIRAANGTQTSTVSATSVGGAGTTHIIGTIAQNQKFTVGGSDICVRTNVAYLADGAPNTGNPSVQGPGLTGDYTAGLKVDIGQGNGGKGLCPAAANYYPFDFAVTDIYADRVEGVLVCCISGN